MSGFKLSDAAYSQLFVCVSVNSLSFPCRIAGFWFVCIVLLDFECRGVCFFVLSCVVFFGFLFVRFLSLGTEMT